MGLRPHKSGMRPAWCRHAATVEPIAPGPTTAMLTPIKPDYRVAVHPEAFAYNAF